MTILIDMDKMNKEMTRKWKTSKRISVGDAEKGDDLLWYEGTHKVALIEGSKGFIVTDGECTHEVMKGEKKTFSLDFYAHEKTENGSTFGILPSFSANMTLEDAKKYATDKQVVWADFVHLFGSTKDRMRCNYALLRKSCKEIGAKEKLPEWDKPTQNIKTMRSLHQASL